MTFANCLQRSFKIYFNKQRLLRSARPVILLDKYFGENFDDGYQKQRCLVGRIYKDAAQNICCSINQHKIELPSDCDDVISTYKAFLDKNMSQNNCLEKLWKCMNRRLTHGIFFPIDLGDNSIYFLYCDFVRKQLVDNNVLISYPELCQNYKVLLTIIKQEIISALSTPNSVQLTTMTETVKTIDRVLQLSNYPSIQLIHALANLKYENQNNEGVICFTDGKSKSKLEFLNPQPLVYKELRALRKYFQMVGDKLTLIAEHYQPIWTNYSIDPEVDVWMIVGIGECENVLGKLYFSSGKNWRFVWDKEEIGYDGSAFFARKRFSDQRILLMDLSFMCTEEEVTQFSIIVGRLMNQKHGTMLVISSIARSEATRLGSLRRAIDVKNYKLSSLSDQELLMISSIDGCILSDTHGNCTALGAILDGEANIATDIGRGARYNSALTYIMKMKEENVKAAAVIISEDGTVDIALTTTIQEKKSYLDKIHGIENHAASEIQDIRFEQRFAEIEDDE